MEAQNASLEAKIDPDEAGRNAGSNHSAEKLYVRHGAGSCNFLLEALSGATFRQLERQARPGWRGRQRRELKADF